MSKSILITGGLGFVLRGFVNRIRAVHPDWNIFVVDKGTYAAKPELIDHYLMSSDDWLKLDRKPKYVTVLADVDISTHAGQMHLQRLFYQGNVKLDYVIHGAAETHVDTSLKNPANFVNTNVMGTTTMLELVRGWTKDNPNLYSVFIETDEIYGPSSKDNLYDTNPKEGAFTEESPLNPTSPYAASKAAAALMTSSYVKTYPELNIAQVRPSNMYGPDQHIEKLIPSTISRLMNGEPPRLYGTGSEVRDWMYVGDFHDALSILLTNELTGVYNIAGENERTNLEIALSLIDIVAGISTDNVNSDIEFIDNPRGAVHDARYNIDSSKFKRFSGWVPKTHIRDGLVKTVKSFV